MKNPAHYGWPLEVKLERGALVVRVGVQTLVHAVTYADWANQFHEAEDEYRRTFAITDAAAFADDVAHAMLRENEDGSTPLSDFLDEITKAAVDDGSMACEYEQRIPYGKTAPCETWAKDTDTRDGGVIDVDEATSELLQSLDDLYPLGEDDKRVERAGRTAFVVKRWMSRQFDDFQARILRLVEEARSAPPSGER